MEGGFGDESSLIVGDAGLAGPASALRTCEGMLLSPLDGLVCIVGFLLFLDIARDIRDTPDAFLRIFRPLAALVPAPLLPDVDDRTCLMPNSL